MNEHETARIAAALHQARPDWPTKQLVTLLSDPRMADRPRRDVFVALAWVACETGTSSPYRVLESGPWWRAAGIEGAIKPREPFDRATFCVVCAEPEDRCRRLWGGDHEFRSVAQAASEPPDVDVHRTVEALKAEVQPTKPPPEPPTPTHTPHGDAARTLLASRTPAVSPLPVEEVLR